MRSRNWISALALRSSLGLSIALLSIQASYTAYTPTAAALSQDISQELLNNNAKFNFELLHDAAKRNYERYMNVVWGSFSFLLIAIGWIITSEKARVFFHEKDIVRKVALAGIGIIFILHLISINNAVPKSRHLSKLMEQDPYVLSSIQADAYYQQYEIPWYYPVFGSLLNGVLFISLGIMVYLLKDWQEPPD